MRFAAPVRRLLLLLCVPFITAHSFDKSLLGPSIMLFYCCGHCRFPPGTMPALLRLVLDFVFFPQSRICNLYLIRGALSVSFPRISSPVLCAWPGLGRSILSHYQGALILVFITALGVLAQI